jgi:hypothetical protein
MFRIGTQDLGMGRYGRFWGFREVEFIEFLKLVFYQRSCFEFFVGVALGVARLKNKIIFRLKYPNCVIN